MVVDRHGDLGVREKNVIIDIQDGSQTSQIPIVTTSIPMYVKFFLRVLSLFCVLVFNCDNFEIHVINLLNIIILTLILVAH